MRKRWIFSAAVVVVLLAATAGIAYAASRGGGGGNGNVQGVSQMVATCDAMHDSPWMQAMHDRMPAALQAQCDTMHERMAGMMGGGSGMMGGAGMMGGSMASHHPSTGG
jgi:hypothetical protein